MLNQNIPEDSQRGDRPNVSPSFKPRSGPRVLKKIRNLNNLALSSIGTLFSGLPSTLGRNQSHAYLDLQPPPRPVRIPAGLGAPDVTSARPARRFGDGRGGYGAQAFAGTSTDDLTPLAREYNTTAGGDYCTAKNTVGTLGDCGMHLHSRTLVAGRTAQISRPDAPAGQVGSLAVPGISRLDKASVKFVGANVELGLSSAMPRDIDERDTLPLGTLDPTFGSVMSLDYGQLLVPVDLPEHAGVYAYPDTPPLSPDSLGHSQFSPESLFDPMEPYYGDHNVPSSLLFPPAHGGLAECDSGVLHPSPQLQEVKEGKKPERYMVRLYRILCAL